MQRQSLDRFRFIRTSCSRPRRCLDRNRCPGFDLAFVAHGTFLCALVVSGLDVEQEKRQSVLLPSAAAAATATAALVDHLAHAVATQTARAQGMHGNFFQSSLRYFAREVRGGGARGSGSSRALDIVRITGRRRKVVVFAFSLPFRRTFFHHPAESAHPFGSRFEAVDS